MKEIDETLKMRKLLSEMRTKQGGRWEQINTNFNELKATEKGEIFLSKKEIGSLYYSFPIG